MTDSDAGLVDRGGLAITLAFVATVAVVGWLTIGQIAASPELQEYMTQSEEWCSSHDGELHNARAFGDHGGLHCDPPNGPSVHMSDVAASGYPAAVEDVESNVDGPWWSVGTMPLLLISGGVAGVAVVASGIRQWRKT